MPTDEAARHHLLTVLEATLGTEAAMTLADHLPPTGWADVARRSDLDHLETVLHARFEADLHRELTAFKRGVDTDLHQVRDAIERLRDGQRHLFFAVIAAFATNTAILLSALG